MTVQWFCEAKLGWVGFTGSRDELDRPSIVRAACQNGPVPWGAADTAAASASVSSGSVIVGGVWAWLHFVRAGPFRTRANLTVETTVDEDQIATVSVAASINADDYVSDILVNGVSTKSSAQPANANFVFQKTLVKLSNVAWKKGVNQIDILVVNRVNANNPNGMLLHLAWTASGSAAVLR